MKWLKKIIHKLFKNNKIKLIKEPEYVNKSSNERNEFLLNIKQSANLEQNDGNGYKIIKNMKLKDMI